MRYQSVTEKKSESAVVGGKHQEKQQEDQPKQEQAKQTAPPPAEFKLDEVNPAFADIFTVSEPGAGPNP